MSWSERITHQPPSLYGNTSDRVLSAEAYRARYGDTRSYYGAYDDNQRQRPDVDAYYDGEQAYASDDSSKAVFGDTSHQPDKSTRSQNSATRRTGSKNDVTLRAMKAKRAYEDAIDAKEMALREMESILHLEEHKKSMDAQPMLDDQLEQELKSIVAAERRSRV